MFLGSVSTGGRTGGRPRPWEATDAITWVRSGRAGAPRSGDLAGTHRNPRKRSAAGAIARVGRNPQNERSKKRRKFKFHGNIRLRVFRDVGDPKSDPMQWGIRYPSWGLVGGYPDIFAKFWDPKSDPMLMGISYSRGRGSWRLV